jgi:predicted DNA-binding protein (MmcQ/YjbR family)
VTCRASSRRLWDRADVEGRGSVRSAGDQGRALAHCLSKPGAWQDEPWEGDTVVKVGPKIFAFLGSGDGGAIPDDEVVDAVDESYRMIVAKLAKRDRPA